jgi:hypothetical protein
MLNAGITRWARVARVRRNRGRDGVGKMFCFAEQRKEDQRGKHGRLDQDRKNERAAPQPAFATALFRIAFDKTSV